VWFGRESRFALDDRRREVTTTMPGHHRIKTTSDQASAGVDFVEALCAPQGEFPFDVVTRQFGPVEGDTVAIGHGKPDGRLITLGRGEVVEHDPDGTVAVRRELSGGGTYDALGVPRERGDVALTKFREGRWWYPTVYRSADDEVKGTYVNVCTSVECFPDTIRYVDLHVDVIKHADGTVERVDDDELDAAVEAGEVTDELAEKARNVATSLEQAL
jgi:Ribonuclease G/E